MWRRLHSAGVALAQRPRLLRAAGVAASGCTLAFAATRDDVTHSFSLFASDTGKPPEASVISSPRGTLYELGRVLGEGAFAVVKLATRRDTGDAYACKLVSKVQTDTSGLEHEVKVLKSIGLHKHICSLIDNFDASSESWALVFELVTGGEVFDRICETGAYSEREAAEVVKQVGLALQHIHSKDIVHRDLKPENLLMLSQEKGSAIKLCDFGLAGIDHGHKRSISGRTGTLVYMAPEQLYGYHPFDPTSTLPDEKIEERIKLGRYDFESEEWTHVSPAAKQVIKRLLHTSPDSRATVDELLEMDWVGGGKASATPLPETTASGLRAFNDARRTWRTAIRAAALIGRSPAAAGTARQQGTTMKSLPAEALEELRAAFQAYDIDGNGTIDLEELKGVLRSLGAPEGEAERTFAAAHTKQSGGISFEEFCQAVGPVYDYSHMALRRAFTVFDADGNGSIEQSELRAMLTKLRLLPSDPQAADSAFQRIWQVADTNKDGHIEFDEFIALFQIADPMKETESKRGRSQRL